jgi:hypothetical protein
MKLFDLLSWFAKPVVRIALAILGPLGILLGIIANPGGAINSLICRVIDVVAVYWPSTPDNLKLANLINGFLTSNSDTIGGAVVKEIYTTAFAMLAIVLLVKLYKLIPFKAT